MKIRGSVVKVVASAAVVLLVCSFLLVAGFRNSRNLFHQNRSSSSPLAAVASSAARANNPKLLEAYGKLPLSFVENEGQTAKEVRYVSHGSQYDLFLTPQEAVVTLRHSKQFDLSPRHRAQSIKALRELRRSATTTVTALRMQFEGANRNPQIAGGEQLPGVVNYYIGNDPQKWHRNIATYAQVKYTGVYPGVDLVFYGNQHKLEYDFMVAPGADPNLIRMNVSGAKKLRLDAQGVVLVSVAGGEVQLRRPVVYQNINGKRQEIPGKYSLRGEHVSFAIAQYDRREPLIIDPVLDYSTYLGGVGDENTGFSIATDTAGDAYIVGQTTSSNFPTASPLSTAGGVNSANAIGQGFVTKLNPTGTALLFSTYLGGTGGGDQAFGVAVDSSENIYVTGYTPSIDFPTNGTIAAFKPSVISIGNGTSYLTKISSSGALTYSTYLGGTNGVGVDYGNAVAVDGTGNAYVTGITSSTSGATSNNFPLMNAIAYATTPNSTVGTAYLSVINTLTGSLAYSTYLGGDGANNAAAGLGFGDQGFGVVADSTGKAYVVGTTTSSNFPTSATFAGSGTSFQPTVNAANQWGEAFLTEIDTTKTGNSSVLYSTYLGGSGNGSFGDAGFGIDLKSGTTIAYLSGVTNSADFPLFPTAATCLATPAICPFQTTPDTVSGSGFVALLDTSNGAALKYGTYLGTGAGTIAYSIKADAAGNAFVAGGTADLAFPVSAGAFQSAIAQSGGVPGPGDGFIFELSPLGNGTADRVYGTYFGGSGQLGGSPDQIFGIALGTVPTVFVTGQTFSTNLPVFPAATAATPAFQTALDGTSDAFVAELTLVPTLVVSPNTLTFNATQQGVATPSQTITLTNNTSAAIAFTGATITSPTPAAAATDFAVTNISCGTSILAGTSCTLGVVFTASTIAESATVTITDGDSSSPQTVALTGTAPALFNISPTTLTFNSTTVGTPTAAQVVTITNNTGAAVPFTSDVVTLTSATGAAADFAATSTCGASVPTTGCTISVVYTPSVATMETATLTITDGVGVQTVALTGTVTAVPPDFTVSVPATLTVTKGKSGTATVTVGSVGGFTSAVALACTGQPNKSTCSIAPSPISPAAGGSAAATLTLTTTSLVAPPPASPRFPPVSIRVVVPVFAALLMLLLFRSEQRFRTRLGLAGALLVFVALAGCSSSSGTAKGTSTLTVTGTSGALTHTATITLTVD